MRYGGERSVNMMVLVTGRIGSLAQRVKMFSLAVIQRDRPRVFPRAPSLATVSRHISLKTVPKDAREGSTATYRLSCGGTKWGGPGVRRNIRGITATAYRAALLSNPVTMFISTQLVLFSVPSGEGS
ncbi:hypothetical protein Bbelb_067730 [Branchiostoma belcheri]|nr:hypothetical protein Bbelb_067730 [Branchiostoma belcheri]